MTLTESPSSMPTPPITAYVSSTPLELTGFGYGLVLPQKFFGRTLPQSMTMDLLPIGDITLPHAVSKSLNEPSPFSMRTVPPVTRNALSVSRGPS